MRNILILKKASIKDLRDIWIWRNNSVTRKNSFNKKYINLKEHTNWFFNSLKNKKRIVLIGFNSKKNKIGLIRLDWIKNKLIEVSINVNPSFRGLGFGEKLLNETMKNVFKKNPHIKICSKVLKKNYKSINLFKKVGFELYSKNIKNNEYRINYKNFSNRYYK